VVQARAFRGCTTSFGTTLQYSGLFCLAKNEANPNSPIQTPSNQHRISLHKAARRVAAVRRYNHAAPTYCYHQRFRFGRLAVERNRSEAGRILAAGNTLCAVEGCADGRGVGLYKSLKNQ